MRILFATVLFVAAGLMGQARAEEGDVIAGSTVVIARLSDKHEGAGVQIRPGVILTAAHVVRRDTAVVVTDDQGRAYMGSVVAANTEVDLALVRVSRSVPMHVSSLSCRQPAIGTQIEMIGHPFGHRFIHMEAIVLTRIVSVDEWPSLIIVDWKAQPGMSGGPVLNERQEVVAIVVAQTKSMRTGRFHTGAVPANVICSTMVAETDE